MSVDANARQVPEVGAAYLHNHADVQLLTSACYTAHDV